MGQYTILFRMYASVIYVITGSGSGLAPKQRQFNI